MPDDARLARAYAVAVAGDLLGGTTSPYDAARELFQVWLTTGRPRDLQRWSGLEDEYELARDGMYGDVAEVERDIREAALRLVDRGVDS